MPAGDADNVSVVRRTMMLSMSQCRGNKYWTGKFSKLCSNWRRLNKSLARTGSRCGSEAEQGDVSGRSLNMDWNVLNKAWKRAGASKTSRLMPWITSIGLMTFPSDLLILRPCESRTMLWNKTYTRHSNAARRIYSYTYITERQNHRATIVRRPDDGRREIWRNEELGRAQTGRDIIPTVEQNTSNCCYCNQPYCSTLHTDRFYHTLSHMVSAKSLAGCLAKLHNSKPLPNLFNTCPLADRSRPMSKFEGGLQ